MTPIEGLRPATAEEIEIINASPVNEVAEDSALLGQSRWVLENLRRHGVIAVTYQETGPGELKNFLGVLCQEAQLQGLRLQTQVVREKEDGKTVAKNIIIKSLHSESNLPPFLKNQLR